MAALLAWMLLQLLPLPPSVVQALSPMRWEAVAAARQATGQAAGGWTALSLAPGATLERLLYVIPAMAAFVAAREMGWWWRDRKWIAVAPVIVLAWSESFIGLLQYRFATDAPGERVPISGTYVNQNHFSGLLEMAFPLAVMGAAVIWQTAAARSSHSSVRSAFFAAAPMAAAACLLVGVVLSRSRTGFLAVLISAGFMALMSGLSLSSTASRWPRRLGWQVLIAATLLTLLLLLPTPELLQRFADTGVSKEGRTEIWRDTLQLIPSYKWTGAGLGAYERGLYRYKTTAAPQTVDFAHNDYLQIMAELGLLGAALAGALGLWILWQPVQTIKRGRSAANWGLAVGLVAALLTHLVHSAADFNLYIPANALALAWLSGVAASFAERPRRLSAAVSG